MNEINTTNYNQQTNTNLNEEINSVNIKNKDNENNLDEKIVENSQKQMVAFDPSRTKKRTFTEVEQKAGSYNVGMRKNSSKTKNTKKMNSNINENNLTEEDNGDNVNMSSKAKNNNSKANTLLQTKDRILNKLAEINPTLSLDTLEQDVLLTKNPGRNYAIKNKKNSKVKVIFLGGIGEIGKNASILNMVLYGDATVFINGTLRIGGLSGYLHGDWNGRSKITNCVFIGNIKGDANNNKVYAGGTIGYNNGGKIVNCFCSGNVIALGNNESFSGGMIGHNQKQDPQMIVNCCWKKGNPTTIESGYAERGIGNHESNVVLFEKLTNLPVIVTTLAAVTKNSSIAIGANQSATISLVTKPDTPQNLSDYIVNPNVVANSYNGDIIEVINNNDLTFTVKPLSVGETPVTLSATLYPTNFSNAANTEDDSLKQQLETTVNIKVTRTPTTPPVSGNGGGCSAGFGVPAFAALAVLILVRKRI